jgi:putative hydrolase of the HAD superfamily
MSKHQIRNIIFDLGGVILDIDPQLTIDAFNKLGWEGGRPFEQKSDMLHFYELETGSDSPETFRNHVREKLGKALADENIDDAWGAMIVHLPSERIHYLEKLKIQYRIFLLSNTNEIHRIKFHKMFEQNFGYSFYDLFEQIFYSHEMAMRKPDPEIFLKALQSAGIKPEETLFIDDLPENVTAAESVGLNGLHILPGTLMDVLPLYLNPIS